MVSADGIRGAFVVLERAGLAQRPYTNGEEAVQVRNVWMALMADLDDHDLFAAVITYARSAAKFWPTVGQLVQLAQADAPDPDDGEAELAAVRRLIQRNDPELFAGGVAPGSPCPPGCWWLHDHPGRRAAREEAAAAAGGFPALTGGTEEARRRADRTFVGVYKSVVQEQRSARDRQYIDAMLPRLLRSTGADRGYIEAVTGERRIATNSEEGS